MHQPAKQKTFTINRFWKFGGKLFLEIRGLLFGVILGIRGLEISEADVRENGVDVGCGVWGVGCSV